MIRNFINEFWYLKETLVNMPTYVVSGLLLIIMTTKLTVCLSHYSKSGCTEAKSRRKIEKKKWKETYRGSTNRVFSKINIKVVNLINTMIIFLFLLFCFLQIKIKRNVNLCYHEFFIQTEEWLLKILNYTNIELLMKITVVLHFFNKYIF